MSLFEKKNFTMHSGAKGKFKIECDALTDEDISTLAFVISQKFKFFSAEGVPRGGLRLANALSKYKSHHNVGDLLIVDDVLTTGRSMEQHKMDCIATHPWLYDEEIKGVVIFARRKPAKWIYPIFQMWGE